MIGVDVTLHLSIWLFWNMFFIIKKGKLFIFTILFSIWKTKILPMKEKGAGVVSSPDITIITYL